MSREEILNGLYDIKSWHCNGNSEMYSIIAEAIKTLEQEPVLDEIRAEIEQKIKKRPGLNHTRSEKDRNDAFLEVLDIIDKYREEQEE